ncbi:rhodanese-like domain-containing protein [Megalodesulfovibrio paquesii]
MSNAVVAVPAASSDVALAHFARKLALETDCWDVQEALRRDGESCGFVLLDVRSRAAYLQAHVPGAISLPHREITAERMQVWPADTLFVVYCAGPHCNGADRAALALARLDRPVKLMRGGMAGWADEGFSFAEGEAPGVLAKLPG